MTGPRPPTRRPEGGRRQPTAFHPGVQTLPPGIRTPRPLHHEQAVVGTAGILVRRREPPLRLRIPADEPSVLRRRSDPCRLLAFRGVDPASAADGDRCRQALLRVRPRPCCPGLRRMIGTQTGIRLRRRRRSARPRPG